MNLIFDLDGTLIDSAPGILSTLKHVVSVHKIDCIDKLKPELVGPPLRELLIKLTGYCENQVVLDEMANTFMLHYDTEGVLETTAFNGVHQMLSTLSKQHSLFIATNKRLVPTLTLTRHFSWNDYFLGIYALDFFKPALKDKAALLQKIVENHGLILADTIYIGDRLADHEAAIQAGMEFLLASWGYEDVCPGHPKGILATPSEIYKYVY